MFSGRALSDTARLRAEYLLTGIAVTALGSAFATLTTDTVRIAANFESIAARLTALGENGAEVADRLREIAIAEDGLTFDNLAGTVAQLRSSGLEIRKATDLTRGFARQLAITNATAEDQTRFFVQLRQAYAGNVAEGNDLRTIFEVMPQLLSIGSQALGVQLRNWKDLRGALDDTGVSLREFFEQSADIAGEAIVDPNQFRVQQERLTEAIEQLQRSIGQSFLPVLTDATRGLTGFFNAISDNAGGFARFTVGVLGTVAVLGTFPTLLRLTGQHLQNMRIAAFVAGEQFTTSRHILTAFGHTITRDVIPATQAWITRIATMNVTLGAAIPIIGATTLAIGAIAIAMQKARAEANEFSDVLLGISERLGVDPELGRARTFADFTTAELRQDIERLQQLRNAIEADIVGFRSEIGRGPGGRVGGLFALGEAERETRRLQTELRAVIDLSRRLQEVLDTRTDEETNKTTDAVSGLSAEIVRATAQVSRLQFAFDNARTTAIAEDLRERFITEAIGLADLQHARARDIEDAERRAAEVARIESVLFDRIIRINRAFRQRQNDDVREAADARRAILEAQHNREVANLQRASEAATRYAEVLRSIPNIARRREFFEMVSALRAQGVALDEAIRQLQDYLTVFQQIPPTLTRADRYFNSFRRQLDLTSVSTERATSNITRLLEGIRQIRIFLSERRPDFEGGVLRGLEAERRAFEDIQPGAPTDLERLRTEARTEGVAFVRRLYANQLREEQSQLREHLNRQFRQYQRFYNRIGDVAVDALFGRIDNFREVALRFFEELTRGIIRVEITERITAARTLAIDTALTNARIANQQRLQAAIANSQHLQLASAGGQGLPSIPGVGGSNLLSGGVGALGVASLLFPTEFRNLGQGISQVFSRAARTLTRADGNINVDIGDISLLFDDGTSRKVADRRRVNASRRR